MDLSFLDSSGVQPFASLPMQNLGMNRTRSDGGCLGSMERMLSCPQYSAQHAPYADELNAALATIFNPRDGFQVCLHPPMQPVHSAAEAYICC